MPILKNDMERFTLKTKADYNKFERALNDELLERSVSYVRIPWLVDQKLQSVPYPKLPKKGTPAERAYKKELYLVKYKADCDQLSRNKDRVEEDFGKAVAVVCKLLSQSVRVEADIHLSTAATNREKFANITTFIFERYGPTNANDAQALDERMRRASVTDHRAIREVLTEYDECQFSLRKILKRDSNGVPLDDGNLTYEWTDDAMRSLLMAALEKCTRYPAFPNIATQAVEDPNMTYAMMRSKVDQHIKRFESTDAALTPTVLPTNQVIVASASIASHGVNKPSGRGLVCANCSKDHGWWDCPSSYCFTCRHDFKTVELRQAHAKSAHARNKRGSETQGNADTPAKKKQQQSLWSDARTVIKAARSGILVDEDD